MRLLYTQRVTIGEIIAHMMGHCIGEIIAHMKGHCIGEIFSHMTI